MITNNRIAIVNMFSRFDYQKYVVKKLKILIFCNINII